MARPKALPYTLGKVTCTRLEAGGWSARGYFRDGNNRRRDVSAQGRTKAMAERALQAKVEQARTQYVGGDAVLNSSTTLSKAADIWLDLQRRKELRPTTMRTYAAYVDSSIKGGVLSELPVSQANNISRIEAWLTGIADSRGNGAASASRKVLSGILGLAERRGAIEASVMPRAITPKAAPGTTGDRECVTEDCDYDCGKRHLDTDRAFTAEEVERVLAAAESAKADVGDLAHFMFVTGVRSHEAVQCTSWADVDLEAQTVRIRGTKTKQADRILELGDDLTERLRERASLHGTEGLVFGITYFTSKLGQPRDLNNVRKALRRVFAAANVQWAGTHTFRRTVASWMDQNGHSLATIADQLGHADINVTAGYLGRKDTATGAAAVMVLPGRSTPALRAVK